MNYNTVPFDVPLPDDAFIFSPTSLYAHLLTLTDKRGRKGRRYPLAALLAIALLAKLCDQNQIRAIAHWAQLRASELGHIFGLSLTHMPHHTTWSRVLAAAVEPDAVTRVVHQFLTQAHTKIGEVPTRGSILLAIDGKTLRGTIPAEATHGVHLVAAYLPNDGIVVAQIAVEIKENEIVVAPKVLGQLDLRGTVVVGDAMFAQRTISAHIVGAGGDYIWTIKSNQKNVLADVEILFDPEPLAPGASPSPTDFTEYTQVNKGHGRLEVRHIVISSMLADYTPWPGLAQAFKIETTVTRCATGTRTKSVRYGITSLPTTVANAARVLALVRGEWGIENRAHWRRDVTFGEDHSQLRMGDAPHVFATLNNTALALIDHSGAPNAAHARRVFNYNMYPAAKLILA